MKILELRFRNLNSLYGEWCIDFTAPEYVSDGIFALTGPTGAGKSTVLDAICLALYGSTPRLGKITRSGNEIMSRQTGECYAEVVFESQAGRFRCHWEQRRARKTAGGALQDQEHQIADADSGKPIETKKSLVSGVIEEKTGMDFERFTRSMLLAQGGFDTFLKADAEKKSRILEQITGTGIYSEISRRVHERLREEREKLNLLEAETSGIPILEPEQEKEIQDDLVARQQQEIELAGKSTETGKAITWLTSIEDLKKEILSLTDEAAKLKVDTEAFKPERAKLEQATKAASLDGAYATLTSLRKQQADDQISLKTDEAAFPELESSANTQAEVLKAAEQLTLKSREELKTASPLIQKIRSLDQKITVQTEAVSEGADACTREAGKIDTDKQARVKEHEKRTAAVKMLEAAELYIKENGRDEWLISGLAGVEEQFGNLLTRQQETTQKEADLEKADTAVAVATKKQDEASWQCSLKKQELESAAKNLQQGKDALGGLLGDKLLREYRAEKETLLREMAFIRKIEELEDHRARLEEGKPCPLCGSTEHPFAEGNVPVPDEIEQKIESLTRLIDQADEQEAAIKKLEQEETTARKNLNDSEKLETEAANDKRAAEKTLAELKDALTKLRTGFDELKLAVSGKLQSLGITEIPESYVESLLESLKSRMNAWLEQTKLKADIDKQIAVIDSEVKRLEAVIDTRVKALAEKQENLKRLKKALADGTEERKQLYGDKKPDDEEGRLNKAIADAEEAEKKARDLNTGLQRKLTTAKTHVESLKKRIEQRMPELKKAEADFSAALIPAGFADEKAFLEARLSQEDRESLSSRAKELDDTGTELKAKQKDRETRLDTEIAKKLTERTLEELEPQFKEYEESLSALRDAVAGLKHKLNENTAARERMKEKQSAVEARKSECRRWEKLHGLIGSADGKKYRNFAQGLTFELMVSHANRQLEKMTDRYLLLRDELQPLELNVVDNYQAGEIRSTRNLSGGESFIVSLSLALGLSRMASRNVRVDSLFLDEGFGTLDEEALETALETLAGLRQDGKLIGVISHVPALKERIGTQITITPVSGGRSTLAGPGCGKVSGGR
ncbi:chromosome segregation protein SMC [Prosthecochloris sp. GSB1]|uniref:AAA family ATPase n=1 Tax=Prosthecochloris sp. GSB1 TaxID=281093 RepID=UPI000B8C89E0|nr:AAA family ATPase [Prosthecochloris sp. GSB1]ASQ90781.1 chromosome segregation protein SMC [Prosthecochloris sp. GSB1]